MSDAIRLYLVHAYRLLVEALTAALAEREDVELCGTASSSDGLVDTLKASRIDIVLIDASVDFDAVVDLVIDLHEALPDIKILPLGLQHEGDILTLLEAGANGYVERDASITQLIETVDLVHADQAPCSPRIATAVFGRLAELARNQDEQPAVAAGLDPRLTPREHEVLTLLANGLRNKEIAQHLDIRLPTVKNHVHRILEKMDAKNRREAVKIAFELRLIDDPIRKR
ncbi:MAG: response regulator transcription factor [Acidobacteriota bacterium]